MYHYYGFIDYDNKIRNPYGSLVRLLAHCTVTITIESRNTETL